MGELKNIIAKAYSLEDGGLYVLQCESKLTTKQISIIKNTLEKYKKERNIDFIILDKGLTIFKSERIDTTRQSCL